MDKVSCSRRKHIDAEVRTRDLCIQNRHSNHNTNSSVEILVLTRICLRLGGCLYAHRGVLLNNCIATGMLLWRLYSSITTLLVWTMVGWYVCMRGRQIFHVCCFCFNSSVRGILVTIPLSQDKFDRVRRVEKMCV